MQYLINQSKYLIYAVLSCSLIIALYSNNFEVSGLVPTTAIEESDSVDSVWASMGQELKLDHQVQSARVQAEIRQLLADKEKLHSILVAAAPYIYFIHTQTQARGLPAELALIPVIESEFNPNDHSTKGATGLWQLMPGTATELGIKVKSSYDGRRNVVSSTKAALAYFNDLGTSFNGNWYLAIAAYNCGQGKIQSAERKDGSTSFWNLSLPSETKHYVPKLLAVAAIIKNPEKYGVELPTVTNKPYFTELKIKKAMSLATIAKSSGVSIDTLRALNPDYNHAVVANKGSYSLLVPIEQAPAVRETLGDSLVTT
ncbi:MAG: transglycosylase SLT domain-containing protein [Gammaproteobacteria bacterium]